MPTGILPARGVGAVRSHGVGPRSPCILAYINKVNTDIVVYQREPKKAGEGKPQYINYVEEFSTFAEAYRVACDDECKV